MREFDDARAPTGPFPRGSIQIMKPTLRSSFTRRVELPQPTDDKKRPTQPWSRNRDAWEASFIVTAAGLDKVAHHMIYPRIPDIRQAFVTKILDVDFQFDVAIDFGPSRLHIHPQHRSVLVLELPITRGRVRAPGYEAVYAADAKVVVEIPIDRASVEVRWTDRKTAVLVLDVEQSGQSRLEIAYRIEGAPSNDLLGPIVQASNVVVNTIMNQLPLQGTALGSFDMPAEVVEFVDIFADALPTRIFLSLAESTVETVPADAVAVHVVCAGKHLARPQGAEFKGDENMAVRLSNGLLTEGMIIPALLYLFKNVQSAITPDAFESASPNVGVKTRQPTLRLDKFAQIAESPLIKAYPAVVEALNKLKEFDDQLGLGLGFGFSMIASKLRSNVLVKVEYHGTLGKFALTAIPTVEYELKFVRDGRETYLVATPTKLRSDGAFDDQSSAWQHFLQGLIVAFISIVMGLVTALIVAVLTFVLGILGIVVEVAFAIELAKVLDHVMKRIDALKDVLTFSKNHPEDIRGIVAKINETKLAPRDVTIDDLTARHKLPGPLYLAIPARVNVSRETCVSLFGQINPTAPKPRPEPATLDWLGVHAAAGSQA